MCVGEKGGGGGGGGREAQLHVTCDIPIAS